MREKIPWLRKSWGRATLLTISFLPFFGYLSIFWWIDRLHPYGAVISQLALSILVCIICSIVMRYMIYRLRDQCKLTHQLPNWAAAFHLAFVIAPVFALMVHPLMVNGQRLLPIWVAIPLGLFLIVFGLLIRLSARQIVDFHSLMRTVFILFFPRMGFILIKRSMLFSGIR
jgi:hypothetical protein